jgi:ribosomal protein S18 acetylase RimI-like enzyme
MNAEASGRYPDVATFLIDLSPRDMQRRLGDALAIYVDAMRYPRGTEDHRASMWMEHSRRRGWQAVAAVDVPVGHGGHVGQPPPALLVDAPMIGVAYGYCGAPDQWWQQQVLQGMQRAGMAPSDIGSLMGSYFELTELHIHPRAQGHGLGEALTRRLLAGRGEAYVLLSTPEIRGEDNRAWRLYRRLGFTDIVRGHHFAGDPRAFAILGRRLPL